MFKSRLAPPLVAAAFAVTALSAAVVNTESFKIQPPDLPPDYVFGGALGLDGDIAVVGGYNQNEFDGDPGSAYVFVRQADGQWTQEARLQPDDGEAFDSFGNSVGVWGDVIIVGASHDDDAANNAGAVYVFERQGNGAWSQHQKLTVSGTFVPLNFGNWADLQGDVAIIGTASNAAFVFEADTTGHWTQQEMLTGDGGDAFGRAIALHGSWAIIGAWGDDQMAIGAGAAHVFRRTASGTWIWEAKLVADDGEALDRFGYSVALKDSLALVGVPYEYDNENGYKAGSVYVFARAATGQWTQMAKLLASDGRANNRFGHSVGIVGDRLVVGAPNAGQSYEGAVYVFAPNQDGAGWNEQAKVTTSDGPAGVGFGRDMTTSDWRVVVADASIDDEASGRGAVYVFDLDDLRAPCPEDVAGGDGVVDQQDLVALLGSWGPCPGCPADVTGDGQVGVPDLLMVLAAWGLCG